MRSSILTRDEGLRLASKENIFIWKSCSEKNIFQDYAVTLLLSLFVRAARVLLRPGSLELLGVGIYCSEVRRKLSDLSQISITLDHRFYVRARRASTESSATWLVMAIGVWLKTHSPLQN